MKSRHSIESISRTKEQRFFMRQANWKGKRGGGGLGEGGTKGNNEK